MRAQDIKDIRQLRPGHRRHFTSDEKRALLTEAFRNGESLSALGRRYDIAVSLLFRWKRELAFSPEQALQDQPPPNAPDETPSLGARLEALESQFLLLADELRRTQFRLRRLEKPTPVRDAQAQNPTPLRGPLRDQV